MTWALALLFLILEPHTVHCPFDNGIASVTGNTKQSDGKTLCEYSHVWIHFDGSLMHDDKHVFWALCEEKQ